MFHKRRWRCIFSSFLLILPASLLSCYIATVYRYPAIAANLDSSVLHLGSAKHQDVQLWPAQQPRRIPSRVLNHVPCRRRQRNSCPPPPDGFDKPVARRRRMQSISIRYSNQPQVSIDIDLQEIFKALCSWSTSYKSPVSFHRNGNSTAAHESAT